MPVDIIGYVNILIGFIDILLGFLVLSSNPSKPVNRAYFFCTLTMGIWSLSLFFYGNPLYLDSTQWLKIVYVISYLMTFAQIYFALKFHDGIRKELSSLIFALLTPLFGYGLYLLLVRNSVVIDTYFDESRNEVIANMGNDYVLYFLPIILSLFFLFGVHIIKGSKLESLKRKQTQYYWVAGFLMIVPLIFLDFVLPVFFSNTQYYQYSTLGNILWAVIIAYSIYNTRFLDVRLVLGKVVEATLKSAYLLVIFLIYTKWNEGNTHLTGSSFILILITISVALSLILNWINQKTELFVQRKFIYSRYNPIEQIQKYSAVNSQELNIKNILTNTVGLIENTVSPEKLTILLFDSRSKTIIHQEKKNFPLLTPETTMKFVNNWGNLNSNPVLVFSEIDLYFSSGKEIIDYRKNEILDFMKEYKVEIIIPFELKSSVGGLTILGNKKDNSLYSQTDITFLESIMRNANVAIERAILYEQLQEFNQTLQEKINDQTKELQIKVRELEEARRKEADMIDIMGHELRTPATVAKLNVELLERYIDSNPEEFKKYLDRIKKSVETEIGLINTLLTSAKLEGNKVEIRHEKVDIKTEIDMALHGHEQDIEGKDVVLLNQVDTNTPYVYADKVRVVEILNNLISNAVKYTQQGHVLVSTRYDEKFVTVCVEDTGKGIPKESLSRLGEKFYRTDNYLGSEIVRPGGTGLGLYVTFGLVRLMGGDISVESELDRGSRFTFTLPVYTGQSVSLDTSNNMFEKLGLKK